MFGEFQHTVFGGCPHVLQPFYWHAVTQQLVVREVGKKQRLRRSCYLSLHINRNMDLLDNLTQLHQLGRAGGGVCLQLPALGPLVSVVVVADIAKDDIFTSAVENYPKVETDAGRPEIWVPCAGEPVQAEAGVGRVDLQVKSSSLSSLLLLVWEPSQAGV